MARYENEPCCGCGNALSPQTEDVVVCPDCGAPMHRDCWRVANACPLAEKHSKEFRWQPSLLPPEPEENAAQPVDAAQPPLVCPECGEVCEPEARRCENCGTDFEEFTQTLRMRIAQDQQRREEYMKENFPTYTVHGRQVSMGDEIAGQPLEEVALQLRGTQRSVRHYLEYLEQDGVGWNWAAFLTGLFGPYWFFFRKLYKPAMLFAGLWLAATLVFWSLGIGDSFVERLTPSMAQVQQAAEQLQKTGDDAAYTQARAALDAMAKEARAWMHQYRWPLAAIGGWRLGMAMAAGLLADFLLKKKLLHNIEIARRDGIEGGQRGFGRHQLLIHLGGVSFFAPMVYFWLNYFLPTWIVQFVGWILS